METVVLTNSTLKVYAGHSVPCFRHRMWGTRPILDRMQMHFAAWEEFTWHRTLVSTDAYPRTLGGLFGTRRRMTLHTRSHLRKHLLDCSKLHMPWIFTPSAAAPPANVTLTC